MEGFFSGRSAGLSILLIFTVVQEKVKKRKQTMVYTHAVLFFIHHLSVLLTKMIVKANPDVKLRNYFNGFIIE
jgi:hypothetical protein